MKSSASSLFPSPKSDASPEERDAFLNNIDMENRWVVLADEIHWEKLIAYYLSKNSFEKIHPEVPVRCVLAAFIIKYKLKLSSRATVQIISENQYLQYFSQAGRFYGSPPLTPELLRNIRDIFGKREWSKFKHLILNSSFSTPVGKLIFKIKSQIKEYKPDLGKALIVPDKNKALDTELHKSIGLDYSATGNPKSATRNIHNKTKKFKKKAKKIIDILLWTIIISLVVGSLIMIVYESDWTSGKKKIEKNK